MLNRGNDVFKRSPANAGRLLQKSSDHSLDDVQSRRPIHGWIAQGANRKSVEDGLHDGKTCSQFAWWESAQDRQLFQQVENPGARNRVCLLNHAGDSFIASRLGQDFEVDGCLLPVDAGSHARLDLSDPCFYDASGLAVLPYELDVFQRFSEPVLDDACDDGFLVSEVVVDVA